MRCACTRDCPTSTIKCQFKFKVVRASKLQVRHRRRLDNFPTFMDPAGCCTGDAGSTDGSIGAWCSRDPLNVSVSIGASGSGMASDVDASAQGRMSYGPVRSVERTAASDGDTRPERMESFKPWDWSAGLSSGNIEASHWRHARRGGIGGVTATSAASWCRSDSRAAVDITNSRVVGWCA